MAVIFPHIREKLDSRYKEGISIIVNSGLNFVEFGVFGSYARDDFGPDSDVDFCIIFKSDSDVPSRNECALLRSKLDDVGCDCIGTTLDRFEKDNTAFYKELRRDYRKVEVNERI